MSRKKQRPRKKKPTRPSEKESQTTPSGEWQAEDVVSIIFNPVYGYGRHLQPLDTVVAHVLRLNRALAERQKSLGRTLTLDELDEEYTALMDRLVAQGLCWHEQDAPPLVSKEQWLRAQQVAIRRLVNGEEIVGPGTEMTLAGETSEFEEDVEEEGGWYDGQCQACELWGRVDDVALCEACRDKLERDLVRLRDWEYSASGFGLSDEGREALYRQVIARHGQALELVASQAGSGKKRSPRKRRR
jgi:hypothetical protein